MSEFPNNKPKTHTGEIRIGRVSKMMKQDIKNIAGHIGVSATDFLKVELLHIIAKHPEHYRKPIEK